MPQVPISETEWQEQVIELAHTLGWKHMFVRRSIGKGKKWTTATNVKGWLDLTMWSERQQRVMFVELKSEAGEPTPEQIAMMKSWSLAGQEVYLWRPSDLEEAARVLRGPKPSQVSTGLAGNPHPR